MKTIDWEHFIMNILTHNLVIQMRMLKKAKEKREASPSTPSSSPSSNILNKINSSTSANSTPTSNTNTNTSSNTPLFSSFNMPTAFNSSKMLAAQSKAALNESNLIDTFYELEAEIEKGICRDNVTFNSPEKEHGKSHSLFWYYFSFSLNIIFLLNHTI
jgi:hypothetical protein